MNDLLSMLRQLMEGNIQVLPGIFDILQEDNSNIRQWQHRQFYSAVGQLLDGVLETENMIEAEKERQKTSMHGKIVEITREDVYGHAQAASNGIDDESIMQYPLPSGATEYGSLNGRRRRTWVGFKNRIREIFWNEWIPVQTVVSKVEKHILSKIQKDVPS